jgi:Secretion system C-terminal sorting domain
LVNTGQIIVEEGTLTVKRVPPTSTFYSGNGSITVNSGATILTDFLDYSNPLLTNNGTITLLTGYIYTINLNGTTQQTIAGTGSINRLKIDNASGVNITGAQTILSDVALASGKIQLGINDLILASGATITTPSATKYVQTNSTGNLKQSVTTTDVLFPVGETNYTPVTIRQTGGTDVYAVRVSDGIDPAHPLNGTAYVAKEWDISRTPSNVTAATVKAEWNAPTDEGAGFTCASAQLLHYNGTIWEALSTAGTTISCAASPNVRSLTRTNVTSFSPFAVGLPSVVLTVELIDFQAVKHNSTIDLLWQTASEKDMSHFDIEQSTDGKTFSKVGETEANNRASKYQFLNHTPLSILAYFRLKIVNTDGSFTYSKVISVSFGKNLTVKAFPNPFTNDLTIDAFSDAKSLDFSVLDVLGRSVYQKKEQSNGSSKSLIINTLDWSSGIYMLKVTDGKNVFQQKIVKP